MKNKAFISLLGLTLSLSLSLSGTSLLAADLGQSVILKVDIDAAGENNLCASTTYLQSLKNLDDPIRLFREAVCMAHDVLDDTEVVASEPQYQRYASAVEALRKAQDAAIASNNLSLVEILEGQVHCKIAKQYVNNNSDLLGNNRFCGSRKAALEVFGNLDWRNLQYSYENDTADFARANSLIGGMTICQSDEGALSAKYDPICGAFEPVSEAQIDDVVETKVFPALVEKYFAEAAPITGIFTRKQKVAQAVIDRAEIEKEFLNDDAGLIAQTHSKLDSAYKVVQENVSGFIRDYQKASLISRRLLEVYTQWANGLLFDGVKNVAFELSNPNGQGAEGGLVNSKKAYDGQSSDAAQIDLQIEKLKIRKNLVKVRALNLCYAFYCSVAAQDSFFGDDPSSYSRACGSDPTFYKTNILCQQKGAQAKPLSINFDNKPLQKSVKVFCTEMGLEADDAVIENSDPCMMKRL